MEDSLDFFWFVNLFMPCRRDEMNRREYLSKAPLCLGLALFGLMLVPLWGKSEVRVWEEPLVIPTYKVGKPDLNPIFYSGRAYQGAKGAVYPYPMLDRLTDVREDKTYNAIYLENDYVKICVLPEIGGRIFSALDKTNNYDFFYRQHVIKPALIGMLGAWISGGVEWNFPHHHRATGFMPVDYAISENPDGSKTIWIGEVEIRHRMKWVIGLTLYPGRSYIEATVKLFNRTPFAHSMLYWANVAVHTNKNYQIIFPPSTEYATYHGKNQFSRWPISHDVFNRVDYTGGVDVSWWKNHPRPTSFFAWNYREDFFAGYDHGEEAGVVHVADRHIMPGKKFWTWGTEEKGRMWEKILTEADGPYIELMVGAFSDNQPDYSWIQPYEVRTFKEYWFPVRKIGGVKWANKDAALNLERGSKNTLRFGLCTTSQHKDTRVVLGTSKNVIFEQKINISPEMPFLLEIDLPEELEEEEFHLHLLSADGDTLIDYRPLKREGAPMPKPVKPPPPPEKVKTIEELYLSGLRLEQFHNPALEAYPYYEEALMRDPYDSRVNTALAILYLKRGMFEEAEERAKRALERLSHNHTCPKNGEAYYYLGCALRSQGKHQAACDALYKATWSQAWASASYFSLAELQALKRDFLKALEFLDRSLSLNAMNTKALNLKAALLRRLDRLDEAKRIAGEVLGFDSLDFWAGNELYLTLLAKRLKGQATEARRILEKKMRGAAQSYLELSVEYGNCGLLDEAIDVLKRIVKSGKKGFSTHPMIYYSLGYYYEKKGEEEEAMENYRLASRMPADYCFPFRLESIQLLRHVQAKNPSDSRAPYYLGNLLYDLQPEKAIKEWEKSKSLDVSFPTVHRNLGLAYARVENDVSKAIVSLEKAVSCNGKDPRLYYELDLLYEAGGVPAEKRLELLEKNHDVVAQRDDALSREIALLVQLGRYERAIDLLSSHHFHVWEGGGRIHNVYVDAHLLKGQQLCNRGEYADALRSFKAALEYPVNLEVGRPYIGGRAAQVCYFIGAAYEALDDFERARDYYKDLTAMTYGLSEMSYYQGLAFRKLGQEEKADRIFKELIDFGEKRLQTAASLGFFAKFGERQSAMRRRAQIHYLLGLGYQGRGKNEEAQAQFKKTLELNINHIWAKKQQDWLDKDE